MAEKETRSLVEEAEGEEDLREFADLRDHAVGRLREVADEIDSELVRAEQAGANPAETTVAPESLLLMAV